MKRDWKYILYLSIPLGLFIAVKLMEPKQYDWNPTYAIEDKNPFGGYVLNELIQDLFKDKNVDVSNLTVYELKDSLKAGDNLIILSHAFRTDKEDTKIMLNHVEKGGHVFVGAESFYGKLSDTLKLETYDYLFHAGIQNQRRDTSYLSFANGRLDSTRHYQFRRENIHNYFGRFDSTRTTIIAKNDRHQPVTIRVRWGKGSFIFTCTPLAFSNIYALRRNNHEFMAITLSHLPEADVKWTEYYSVGRLESSTPLRFILTHPPLAWAYYITVLALLLFMIFEAKRKQRIIPIMPPLQNTSLEFVGTIGNLYYQRSDHKNIADKKILFFLEMIRSRYLLSPGPNASNFISQLARKSGKPEQTVTRLFKQIDFIRGKASITKEQLIELNKAIEAFTLQDKK